MHKIHEHGVDIGGLYYNALMCASTEEETTPMDVMFSTYATRAPRCLFDLPVRKLTWDSQKLEFKTLEDKWEL